MGQLLVEDVETRKGFFQVEGLPACFYAEGEKSSREQTPHLTSQKDNRTKELGKFLEQYS